MHLSLSYLLDWNNVLKAHFLHPFSVCLQSHVKLSILSKGMIAHLFSNQHCPSKTSKTVSTYTANEYHLVTDRDGNFPCIVPCYQQSWQPRSLFSSSSRVCKLILVEGHLHCPWMRWQLLMHISRQHSIINFQQEKEADLRNIKQSLIK